mgnify:CR=1 FL=1
MENTKDNSLKKIVISCVCLVALVVAGVFAYLTATDTVENKFSVATELDIEVVEPNWNPDNAVDLLPTEEVAKDPAIHNKTDKDMWVFADVVIPTKDIVTAKTDGTKLPSGVTELFTFDANPGWTLADKIVNDDDTVTYRYIFDEAVAGNATTDSIFNSVKVCNYVDEQFDTQSAAKSIFINGYGIQKQGFDTPSDAYTNYFGEEPKTIIAQVIVNDDEIEAGDKLQIVDEKSSVITSNTTATEDDKATFEIVPVIPGNEYAVVIEGGNPSEDAVNGFVADEDVVELAASGEPVILGSLGGNTGTAFAVYSADDKSLNFYKREAVPSAGEQFEGKAATNVYVIDEENCDYSNFNQPWSSHDNDIKSVSVVDGGITPVTVNGWFTYIKADNFDIAQLNTSRVTDGFIGLFAECNNVKVLDLSAWDVSNINALEGMFLNCYALKTIYVSESWNNIYDNSDGGPFMFEAATSLVGGAGTSYLERFNAHLSCNGGQFAHIDGGTSNPGYFTLKP